MATDGLAALERLMDRYAREHWNDSYSPSRGKLSIDGDALCCTIDGESMAGDPSAPLMFVSGAWALIYAHETGDGYGHRVDGKINRIWPHGLNAPPTAHGFGDEVLAWAKLWPDKLFSSELYRGVDTPGHPHWPRSLDGAPGKTSLSGVMKRAVTSAGDADPLERLKVAEFVLFNLREWSMTAEDLMMGAIGKPLMALSRDPEPATREIALLVLESCAFRCWCERAYGLYEPLCERLIEAGLNVHLQYARLAESAYAAGRIDEGDRLWALASAGINPLKVVKLSAAHDHIGDWNDLHIRILRQAGGAHVGRMLGNDPNPARHRKLEKKGIQPPSGEVAAQSREAGRALLARAAEGAEARLTTDLAAIREGGTIQLGSGDFDPGQRRLFLSEIFALQSRIAEADGDKDEQLRLLFKAMTVDWELAGCRDGFEGNYDDTAFELAAGRDEAEAITLYRFVCGTDPIVQPWPYRNPVPPLPLEAVPESLRGEVAARSPLEQSEGHAKVKPRGKRAEQLAAEYDESDAVSARYIAHCLREACKAGDSEIVRALKAAQPLLLKLLAHPHPAVRDGAILGALELLPRWKRYAPGLDAQALLAAIAAMDIVDNKNIMPVGGD